MKQIIESFFPLAQDPAATSEAEKKIRLFELSTGISLPPDYKEFLVNLEAFIDRTRSESENVPDFSLEEYIDDIFATRILFSPA